MAAGLKPIDMKFILSCLLLFPVLLWADKVATKDGSVIVGKVLNLEAGTLYIETEFSGKLEIPTSQILSITSDDVVSLRLEDNSASDSIEELTAVSWDLDLSVWIHLPKMITLLPDGLVQSSGDHLLRQIVRQISRRLTWKVQEDFHASHGLECPPRRRAAF